MTEKELVYIITIAQEKSIQAAAKKLYISQPALSKTLTKLERRLNTKLFTRKPSGVTLTASGEKYYNTAKKISKIYNDMKIELNDLDEQLTGNVVLGVPPFLSACILADIIEKFQSVAPHAKLSIVERSSTELTKQLKKGELDLVLVNCNNNEINKFENIDYNNVYTNNFLFVYNKKSEANIQLLHKSPNPTIDLNNSKNLNFILTPSSQTSRTIIDNIFHFANYQPKIILESRNHFTILNLIEKNLGVGIIPELYYNSLNKSKEVVALSINQKYQPKWYLCILTQSNDYLTAATSTLIKIINEYFGT